MEVHARLGTGRSKKAAKKMQPFRFCRPLARHPLGTENRSKKQSRSGRLGKLHRHQLRYPKNPRPRKYRGAGMSERKNVRYHLRRGLERLNKVPVKPYHLQCNSYSVGP